MNKTNTISDEAVKKATGRTWEQWFDLLKSLDAKNLPHKEIARALNQDYHVDGWWAQSITVHFEKAIGRRVHGQIGEGNFQTSASKTLPGDLDQVLRTWIGAVGRASGFDGLAFDGEPKVSKTEDWRYWRVDLKDGTKVTAVIGRKGSNKTTLTIDHEKLPDSASVERWKEFWKGYLGQLKEP